MPPFGAFTAPTDPRFVANGQEFDDIEPGTPFIKACYRVAERVGYTSNFYVSVARNGGPSVHLTSQELAPDTVEAGMVVSISPHSEGA